MGAGVSKDSTTGATGQFTDLVPGAETQRQSVSGLAFNRQRETEQRGTVDQPITFADSPPQNEQRAGEGMGGTAQSPESPTEEDQLRDTTPRLVPPAPPRAGPPSGTSDTGTDDMMQPAPANRATPSPGTGSSTLPLPTGSPEVPGAPGSTARALYTALANMIDNALPTEDVPNPGELIIGAVRNIMGGVRLREPVRPLVAGPPVPPSTVGATGIQSNLGPSDSNALSYSTLG